MPQMVTSDEEATIAVMEAMYDIREPVWGSFAGRAGRVTFDVPAGRLYADEIGPEVLERLIRLGYAAPVQTAIEEGDES